MEELNVEEVIYEVQRHASSRPYVSNYPPQPSTKANEAGKTWGLLSLIGFSQIKEKWRDHKNSTSIKKHASLFISPRGEHVAVATENQITILHKEDDYQEPYGIFTSSRPVTFTCGVWSEGFDVLGVVDAIGTVYFVKANGEEISRITNQELNLSSTVIGLLLPDHDNPQGSCLCSFIILMADGSLQQIEASQEPSASISISQTSANGLNTKRQFPKDVFCIEYDPQHSLLLLVGGAVGTSLSSSGHSGSCHLSLWRKSQNLYLEPLFSIQFEGFYCKPKDYGAQLANRKVLMSPKGKYIATLDLTGHLHIFKLDIESCSVTSFAGGERLETQGTNKLSNGSKSFVDIKDFTWWSDQIIVFVKRDGVVTLFNIFTGLELQENNHVCVMPVLDRVQQLEGHIFLLESRLSKEIQVSSNYNEEASDPCHSEQATGGCGCYDVSLLRWSLISFSQRSVFEMYNILIHNNRYDAALDFADHHGLDRDEVFKSQWLNSAQGLNEINLFLSNIRDQGFVISECVDKVGETEGAVRALLSYGLQITEQFSFSKFKDCECDQIWEFRMVRLQLLQFRDRLETYVGINMGRFSVQEYSKFRFVSLSEAAVTLAESGKIGALNLLFKRHPYSLSPSILQVLAAVPETVPVQTYGQLLPGKSPPSCIALREEDWVECGEMLSFINRLPENHEIGIQSRTEAIVKRCLGYHWPSTSELCLWYKNRARDIDCYSGQLDNSLCLIDFACQKGIFELQQYHQDISYLHQLIYSDESDVEKCFNMSLVAWEQLSDYDKFRMMLKEVKEDNVVKKLRDIAIPYMQSRLNDSTWVTLDPAIDEHSSSDHKSESFVDRWLRELAAENKLGICLNVIEEGCKELKTNGFFRDEFEVVDCALQCIYLCAVTDRWNTMDAILSRLPQKQGVEGHIQSFETRLKLAREHIEAGRLLSFYQVPKPIAFFLEAHRDEKGVKQILRLILSKFVRRSPGRSDNDWANMWQDMQCIQEKAFPFLDPEYMLMEFCRGLLKAGKFSLARNYLKGTSSVALSPVKAENLVIQAAREYFFSASSLSCSEIWKAKECLSLFPSSRNVKAEADIVDALTVKLPDLGVNLLPMQFRQIKDPMEIVKMAIANQAGAYLHVDELIDVANLLGLRSLDDISGVEEAIAREAAVAGDLQLAFDLCLTLTKKGHGPIWDLCTAIARGPALENMDLSARKQLLGFSLSHCDEESIGELLLAWKDIDMQIQCENLLTGIDSPKFIVQGPSTTSPVFHGSQDMIDLKSCTELVEGVNHDDPEVYFNVIKNMLSTVAKSFLGENGLGSLWRENTKILSFATCQLPWLLELSRKTASHKILIANSMPGKHYVRIQTQAAITILSWLARNGFAPHDSAIASLTKSIIEPPVTEEEDVVGCSFLVNLADAFSGVEVIEEQLRTRQNYQEICSIMNVGLTYSLLHSYGVECKDPAQRRELLQRTFKEKQTLTSDEMIKINELQSTFWREWKLKLEEKKRITEHSRELERIIPGVEAARFLTGDLNYIESIIFSVIESVKLKKKCIMKDLLKLADTYGLNHSEVLLRCLSSILVSENWTEDEITAEISEVKEQILGCASETIKIISKVVYPAIDGCNKQRLAYLYGLLSDCFFQLEETKQSLSITHLDSSHLSALQLAHLCKIFAQECERVSFIKDLNFKNIAKLEKLNLESFQSEVYRHIDEANLEVLAEMVETLVSICAESRPGFLMSWKDVYGHYVLSLLANLETRATKEFNNVNPEKLQEFISQLEKTYHICRKCIEGWPPSDALDIMKRYFTVIIPLHDSCGTIPDNSSWQDSLIVLLNFWSKLAEEMQKVSSLRDPGEKLVFNAECLSSCLKVFTRLIIEDNVSPSQCWGSIIGYVSYGLVGDFAAEIVVFCRAMLFSGCGFGAISEVFLEAMTRYTVNSTPTGPHDLSILYLEILEPILRDLVNASHEPHNLFHLLSSLSKLEGQIEDLQRVRQVVWERMAQFSDDMQLPNHVRVYALELLQFISGRNIKGFSTELQSCVLPWEGWHVLLSAGPTNSDMTTNSGLPDHTDASNRLTSALVALKSSQIAAAISPTIEISPADLVNLETAASCFLKLCESSSTDLHFDALVTIMGEWEVFYMFGKDEVDSAETFEAANNWSNDDWDEGWESFQEVESLEKEQTEKSVCVHPLHGCWMEIFKKLITFSRFNDVLRLIDQSLSKSNVVLLDDEDARNLARNMLEFDYFMALKVALLLPYKAVQLQCLSVLEDKLKQGGISDAIGRDYQFLTVVLYSGIISTIITDSLYGCTFSYICYLVGSFSRQCQEALLPHLEQGERNECTKIDADFSFLFRRILFPCFISDLVKADQQILAGFIVTKYMHTNPSLSVINVAEASLCRFLDRHLHSLNHQEFSAEGISSCEALKHTVARLEVKLENQIQSALALLSIHVR
uniref:Uncharacterized protein MANES_01G037200 n=1 Tax=Rhizophora mucronata TaxID=61149 RepID=A0A2P2JRB4_RHIMU